MCGVGGVEGDLVPINGVPIVAFTVFKSKKMILI